MAMTPYTGGLNINSMMPTSYNPPMMPTSYDPPMMPTSYDPPMMPTSNNTQSTRPKSKFLDFFLAPWLQWNEAPVIIRDSVSESATASMSRYEGDGRQPLNAIRKNKRAEDHTVKRRELESGAESSSQIVKEVSAQCGDDVTLPCSAPPPDSVDGLEWTRSDLDQYIYLYRDGQPDMTEQHQDYRGRCELKEGTATLLLKNVTAADRGIYECHFIKHDMSVRKRSIIGNDPVIAVQLRVRERDIIEDNFMMPTSSDAQSTQPTWNNLDPQHANMSQWLEKRRQRAEDHTVKRRELESGAESSSQIEKQVFGQCEDHVTLPCTTPQLDSVDGLMWTRKGLEQDQYVYLYRDGHQDMTKQHQDYRGRCELKEGTATLLLKNMTAADNGIYECRFIKNHMSLRKRAIIDNDPVSVVHLKVGKTGACADPEEKEDEDKDKENDIIEGTKRPHDVTPHYEKPNYHYGLVAVVGLCALFGVILGIIFA